MKTRRYELSDEQWEQIKELFPAYTTGRPSKRSNREMFNAMLWIARSGAPWRDLPERYGFWKTVYARFCKWRNDGTLVLIFQTLQIEVDFENVSIDSTSVRAHQHSAGAKKRQQPRVCPTNWGESWRPHNENTHDCRCVRQPVSISTNDTIANPLAICSTNSQSKAVTC